MNFGEPNTREVSKADGFGPDDARPRVYAAWAFEPGLLAIRATAARHHFQMLDFLAHGFVEDGVGQEDQPVRAGVRVGILASFAGAEYARLFGVHSL